MCEIKVSDDLIDYDLIPDYMKGNVKEYIEKGRMLGGFLQAVFENNLVEAYSRADNINTHNMRNYAQFLYCHAPAMCWGDESAVKTWCELGGIEGIKARQNKED